MMLVNCKSDFYSFVVRTEFESCTYPFFFNGCKLYTPIRDNPFKKLSYP